MHRISWFSTCSPELRSARLSEELLPLISERSTIRRFADIPQRNIAHYSRAFSLDDTQRCDFSVHVVEDDPRCCFIEQAIRIHPGAAIVFDVELSRLVLHRHRQSTGASDINREYRLAHGEKAPPLGDYHVRRWPTDVFRRFVPLGSSLLAAAQLAVFPGQALERAARKLLPELLTARIPLPLEAMPAENVAQERRMLRAGFELPEGDFVVGFSGRASALERAPQLVEALAELRRGHSGAKLFWILDSAVDESLAHALASAHLPGEAFRIVVPQSPHERASFHAACDAFVLVRPDPRRGAPLSFLHAAARSLPCVVSSVGFGEDLDDAVVQLRPDGSESRMLAAVLSELAARPEFRLAIKGTLCALVRSRDAARSAAVLLSAFDEHAIELRRRVREYRDELRRRRNKLLTPISDTASPLRFGAERARAIESLGWTGGSTL